MKQARTFRLGLGALLLSCAGIGGCQDTAGLQGGASRYPLSATCLPAGGTAPADAWVCPAPLSLACVDGTGSADPPTLFVPAPGDAGSCEGQTLAVEVDSLRVGAHDVLVRDAAGALVCQAELTVTDTVAPVLTPKPQLKLWPPNHKFHTISVDDCFSVSDDCEGPLRAQFVWASSDEPVDSIGDGHHAPDIQIDDDCGAIALRAERQGPKHGRVYKLGVRVVDRAGNATERVCSVIVDHDQRGVDGDDSGEAYRVTFDGTSGSPKCDGEQPPPPPPNNPPPSDPPPSDPPPSDPPPSDPPPSDPPVDGPSLVD